MYIHTYMYDITYIKCLNLSYVATWVLVISYQTSIAATKTGVLAHRILPPH